MDKLKTQNAAQAVAESLSSHLLNMGPYSDEDWFQAKGLNEALNIILEGIEI